MKEKRAIILVLFFIILLLNGCGDGGDKTPSRDPIIHYGIRIFTDDGEEYKAYAWVFMDGYISAADIFVCGVSVPVDQTKVSIGALSPGDPVPVSISHPQLGGTISTTLTTVDELNEWFNKTTNTLTISWTNSISGIQKGGLYIVDEHHTAIASETWEA